MVYAFISYSRQDVDFIKKFTRDLKSHSISYWRDENDILPWNDWDREIRKTLASGKVTHFLYFHSIHSVNSDPVQAEIAFAKDKKIKILVLRLDESERPLLVYKNTYFDLFRDYETEFQKLISWLNKPDDTKIEVRKEVISEIKVLEPTVGQKQAAHDNEHQRIKVIAGPGTGKSFVIEERVKLLLKKGVSPKSIFVVSFTREASKDLEKRIHARCKNEPGYENVRVSTLHSLALKALQKAGDLSKYPVNPRVLSGWELTETFDKEFVAEYGDVIPKVKGKRVRNRVKQIRLYHEALWSTQEDEMARYQPDIEIIDKEKKAFEKFRRVFSRTYATVLPGELIAECVGKIDMGLKPVDLLGIEHLLVDEFQDLNYADNLFVEAIASDEKRPKTYVLGDDDQSIYAFRFAYPPGIRDFVADKTYTLSECFRCTPEILKMATEFIEINSTNSRLHKDIISHHKGVKSVVRINKFKSETKEADFIANSCKKLVDNGVDPESILILISNRDAQLEPIVNAFDKIEVAVDTPRQSEKLYFDYEWSKHLIAILRVATDMDLEDYIAHRLVLGFQEGVGRKTCSKIKNKVVDNNLNYLEIFYHKLPKKVFSTTEEKAIGKAKAIFEALSRWTDEDTVGDRLTDISKMIQDVCRKPKDELASKVCVQEWERFVSTLPNEMTIHELLSYLSSDQRSQATNILKGVYERLAIEIPEDDEMFASRVQIKTMHGAKGLNAHIVFVPGLENDIIPGPHRTSFPGLVYEAARLLYVSITRPTVACFPSFAGSRQIKGMGRLYDRDASDFVYDMNLKLPPDEIDVLTDEDVELVVQGIEKVAPKEDNKT